MSVNAKVFEKIAQVEKLLEEIKGEIAVGEFKIPTVTTSETTAPTKYTTSADLPPVEKAAPIKSEIDVDWGLLDYLDYGVTIKPKKFLGDKWSGVNQILTANNYIWIRDGANSHWRFQSDDAAEEAKPSPSVTSRPVKTDEIKWNIKDGTETVEARSTDPKAWAFVKKYDREAKKSTDEVKSENLSLYEYLKANKEYFDDTYRYTMSKDEAFFSREKT